MNSLFTSLKIKAIFVLFILSVCLSTFIILFISDMRMESYNYRRILQNESAVHNATQRAIGAAQTASQAMYKSVSIADMEQFDEVKDLGRVFQLKMIEFELFLEALIYGSETEEFKNNENGLTYSQWVKMGFSTEISVPKSSPEIRQKAHEVEQEYYAYAKFGRLVIKSIEKSLMAKLKGQTSEAGHEMDVVYEYLNGAMKYENQIQIKINELIRVTEESTELARRRIEISLANRVRRLTFMGFIFFIMAILLVWFFTAKVIIRPLEKLMEGVKRISEGDWNEHLAIQSADEIGQLAASFNNMIDALKKTVVSKELLQEEISFRKQTEDLLKNLRKRIELILNSVSEGIFGIDGDGRINFVNPAACSLLGWEFEHLIGKKHSDVIEYFDSNYKKYAYEDNPVNKAVMDVKERYMSEEYFSRKDGQKLAVEYGVVPLLEGALVTGAVVNFSDISDRKRLENQLVQSQKMESIGRLAGGIAHDFNNLLMVISGNCDFLKSGLDTDSKFLEDVDEIKKASNRAISLTGELLAFSRHQLMKPENININDIIVQTMHMMKTLLGESVQIRTQLDKNLKSVNIDPAQMEQILINLAVNSRDAMSDGGIFGIETATVDLGEKFCKSMKDMEPGEYVMVTVSDNGTGIREDVKTHIFEPFYTTKPKGKGTGLGLATVYGIINQNKGFVSFDSEEGRGTSFYFYFRTVSSEKKGSSAVKKMPVFTGEADLPRGSERILLVEDEAALRKFVSWTLKGQGYQITEASNGVEALKKYGDLPFDLLLTDLVMPQMGGRELSENMLKIQQSLKVIFMSGYTDDVLVRERIFETNIPFLQKPISREVLILKIREVLDEQFNVKK